MVLKSKFLLPAGRDRFFSATSVSLTVNVWFNVKIKFEILKSESFFNWWNFNEWLFSNNDENGNTFNAPKIWVFIASRPKQVLLLEVSFAYCKCMIQRRNQIWNLIEEWMLLHLIIFQFILFSNTDRNGNTFKVLKN